MEKYSIKYELKAQNVKRWHTQPVLREQNLAEHQWNVATIAISLAIDMDIPDLEIMELAMNALVHDKDEIENGDIPSPAKKGLRNQSTGNIGDDIVKAADKIEALHFYMAWGIDDDTKKYCKNAVTIFTKNTFPALATAIVKMRQELNI